ncbi:hypothetical protein CN514_21835 [Bacillus sp. AFS001701]|uniref:putative immunity/bacteriocin fusion bifunctional protein n=1 Tax=Bacillaceae TaxID=186817 RepID=UPI000BF71E12|nr:putative immunity/bacteriocin fusion bifunctional protein [Bacillus sp. AFS001701]PET44435.1 hypothetical protein CN514_21835 [Bacillus sp. AFS001701]
MLKKLITLCTTFILLIGLVNGTVAKAESNDCSTCLTSNEFLKTINQLADAGTTTDLNVDKKEQKDIDKIVSTKDKEFKTEIKSLGKEGYKAEPTADKYIIFSNLKDNGITYEKVGVATNFYIKSNKEIASKQVWIDMKTNEVIRYDLVKINEDGTSNSVVSFDKNSTNDNTSGISTYKFKFNGVSFACSMAGLIACTAAFGGLAVVVPAVGAVAGLGCAIAFNVGCSF